MSGAGVRRDKGNGLRGIGRRVDGEARGATSVPVELQGGEVESHGDHRIAMAFSIAGQLSSGEVRIGDVANVATSFPDYDGLATGAGFGLRKA